jgi:DNA transposition AAA+ family ATPase
MTAYTLKPKANPLDVTVPTRSFKMAQTLAKSALETAEIAGFFGDPGTGKTHAIRYFCRTLPVPYIFITASPSPQRKEIFEEILLATLGPTAITGTAPVLRRLCEEVLAEERRVLVIDECQNLRTIWHQQLRSLHDHQGSQFALLMVGGMNASETLKRDQQLWSRIGMRMEFQPLKDQELLDTLHRLDPILANTDDELLARIDDKDCRGNLRNWTKVLGLARQFGTAGMDRLDERLTRAIFAARGQL